MMVLICATCAAVLLAISWWGWGEYQATKAEARASETQMAFRDCVIQKTWNTDTPKELAEAVCRLRLPIGR